MSLRPIGVASSNLVTLGNDIQSYYEQVHYKEDSDDGYESEEDDGPYWKVALQTAQNDQYYEEDEYNDDGYYAEPIYKAYPAEWSSTHISEAREKAARLPNKPLPKQRFEGVFPPPLKKPARPTQNTPAKPVVPTPAPVPTPHPHCTSPPAQPI
jgi:hypothetical protein